MAQVFSDQQNQQYQLLNVVMYKSTIQQKNKFRENFQELGGHDIPWEMYYSGVPTCQHVRGWEMKQLIYPIGSMYGISTYIELILMANLGKYTSAMDPS